MFSIDLDRFGRFLTLALISFKGLEHDPNSPGRNVGQLGEFLFRKLFSAFLLMICLQLDGLILPSGSRTATNICSHYSTGVVGKSGVEGIRGGMTKKW